MGLGIVMAVIMMYLKTIFLSTIYIFVCCPLFVNAQEIKIVTFNIRGDLKGDRQNQWKYRKPYMTDFLISVKPDILCFQEAEEKQTNDIRTQFPMMEAVGDFHEKRPYYKRPVPILFNRDKFEFINSGCFGLSEKPDSIGILGWDAKYARMAIWVNLKSLQTGKSLFVINTHLDNVGYLARLRGIKQIMDSIPLLSKAEKVVLTGDFNCSENSEVYRYVIRHLKDTYHRSSINKGIKYTFHGYGSRDIMKRHKIDYIFVSKDVEIRSVFIPKEEPVGNVYLSDHNPVISTICL